MGRLYDGKVELVESGEDHQEYERQTKGRMGDEDGCHSEGHVDGGEEYQHRYTDNYLGKNHREEADRLDIDAALEAVPVNAYRRQGPQHSRDEGRREGDDQAVAEGVPEFVRVEKEFLVPSEGKSRPDHALRLVEGVHYDDRERQEKEQYREYHDRIRQGNLVLVLECPARVPGRL